MGSEEKAGRQLINSIWDKMLPLENGTKVRYIKNMCKHDWESEEWFLARESCIGKIGTVNGSLSRDSHDVSRYFKYFERIVRLYSVKFERPIKGYSNYWCTREELEVVCNPQGR
jgi:hypothetical protein